MDKWTIEYDNDTGPNDEGFWEWWTVTDGKRRFDCDDQYAAIWLATRLNGLDAETTTDNGILVDQPQPATEPAKDDMAPIEPLKSDFDLVDLLKNMRKKINEIIEAINAIGRREV